MGTRLVTQRRGKGSPTFRAKKKGKKSAYCKPEKEIIKGEVVDFSKEVGRNGLLVKVLTGNSAFNVVAAEGMFIGQEIQIGTNAEIGIGNVLPLSNIPEGCPIFNVEMRPGDGGKLVRATGSYALLSTRSVKTAMIKLPSGKMKKMQADCRATIGNAACGERTDKPFVKAGAKFHYMKAKSRTWPNTRGVAMNAVDHPFGGEQHHAGKSKSVSRHAPPGRKVGAIASSRTGRKKRK